MRVRDVGVQAGQLIRLAGDLHDLGLDSVVRLPPHHEPSVEIPLTTAGPATPRLRIMAVRRRRTWMFSWGRGRHRRIPTTAPDAAQRIAIAVQAALAAQVARAAESLSKPDNMQTMHNAQAVPAVRVFWRAR